MKRIKAVATAVLTAAILTACAANSNGESVQSSETSSADSTSSSVENELSVVDSEIPESEASSSTYSCDMLTESTSESDSGKSVFDGLSDEEKQGIYEDAAMATAYYYVYMVQHGLYQTVTYDENAYWKTLEIYTSLREKRNPERFSYADGHYTFAAEDAQRGLYVLFSGFDGTLETEAPEETTSDYYKNGKYFFTGGDFGDDGIRIDDFSDNVRSSDGYYLRLVHYDLSNGDIFRTFIIKMIPRNRWAYDNGDPQSLTITSMIDISDSDDVWSPAENETFNLEIGDRTTETLYYKDDPSQAVLVTNERMLPHLEGGDASIAVIRNQIAMLSAESDDYAQSLADEYNELGTDNFGHAIGSDDFYKSMTSLLSLVSFDDGKYITLRMIDQSYRGGAPHGSQRFYYYVLDKESGKRLNLSDVINNDEDDFEAIFTKYFKENEYEGRTNETCEEITAKRTLDEYHFFLSDSGLIITFNRGELGGTSLGQPDFAIPYSELDMKISVGKGDQEYDPEEYYYDM